MSTASLALGLSAPRVPATRCPGTPAPAPDQHVCSTPAAASTADEYIGIETPPAPPRAEALPAGGREARRGVCDTGRYRMPYFVGGGGPPVVYIHGLADQPKAFVPVMAPLRRD